MAALLAAAAAISGVAAASVAGFSWVQRRRAGARLTSAPEVPVRM